MTPDDTFSSIVRLVPHWYRAEHGPFRFETKVNDEIFSFHSLRNLTPDLCGFWKTVQSRLPKYIEEASKGTASFVECLHESLVEQWLRSKDVLTDWGKVIGYVRFLLNCTCENLPVAVNLVVDEQIGEYDIADRLLRFISYEEIPWADTEPAGARKTDLGTSCQSRQHTDGPVHNT